jgi:hypothetical protein
MCSGCIHFCVLSESSRLCSEAATCSETVQYRTVPYRGKQSRTLVSSRLAVDGEPNYLAQLAQLHTCAFRKCRPMLALLAGLA